MKIEDRISRIRRLELRTKRLVSEGFAGAYRSVFKGQGVEFSEVRLYTPGDDVRLIDWNVSSRFSSLYVKQLIEERELNVILVLDLSASSWFGTQENSKLDLATEVLGLIAFSAVENGDRVGFLAFTNKIERYIIPKRSRNQVLRMIRDILCFPAQTAGTSLSVALEFLDKAVKKKSVIFLISDFLTDEDFTKPLTKANKKHDVIAIVVRDKREFDIPEVGYVQFQDAETGEVCLVNTSSNRFQERFRALEEERRARLTEMFRKAAVNVLEVRTDLPYYAALVKFFAKLAHEAY